ncbi:MAG: NAD-dependent epimerase/dehydratase family protein [Candidatus Heimdallarchaeota archaeon]|nr:NAD-dependent epimerase/dehydratase family protein [Candidatus Heimdallarchaeota archaeon]
MILITGATGFLGSVHTRSLLASFSPRDLRILALPSEDVSFYADLGVDIFRGNLAFPSTLTGIMADVTTVYHLAAIVVNDSVSREEMLRVNFEGTRALVDAFLRSTSSERFIFSSSLGVYGFSFPSYPIPETFPLNPQNNYHESKMLAERYLLNASSTYGFHASALRNAPIVGPFDTVTSLRVARGLLAGDVSYLGKGSNAFSMVDVRDSSNAMLLVANHPRAKGEVYNIKSFDLTQREYFTFYADACGGCYPKRTVPVWLAYLFAWFKELTTPKGKEVLVSRNRIRRFTNTRLLDTTKIETDLGFTPEHTDAKTVISEAVRWLIDNGYLPLTF